MCFGRVKIKLPFRNPIGKVNYFFAWLCLSNVSFGTNTLRNSDRRRHISKSTFYEVRRRTDKSWQGCQMVFNIHEQFEIETASNTQSESLKQTKKQASLLSRFVCESLLEAGLAVPTTCENILFQDMIGTMIGFVNHRCYPVIRIPKYRHNIMLFHMRWKGSYNWLEEMFRS